MRNGELCHFRPWIWFEYVHMMYLNLNQHWKITHQSLCKKWQMIKNGGFCKNDFEVYLVTVTQWTFKHHILINWKGFRGLKGMAWCFEAIWGKVWIWGPLVKIWFLGILMEMWIGELVSTRGRLRVWMPHIWCMSHVEIGKRGSRLVLVCLHFMAFGISWHGVL